MGKNKVMFFLIFVIVIFINLKGKEIYSIDIPGVIFSDINEYIRLPNNENKIFDFFIRKSLVVEIDNSVNFLFKGNPNKNKELKIISDTLKNAFMKVINEDYKSNLICNIDGKSTKKIIMSMDMYMIGIKLGLRKIKIIFAFSSSVAEYYNKVISQREEGKRYLTIDDIKDIDCGGMTNCEGTIWIFNSFRDEFKYRSIKYTSKNTGFTYHYDFYFISDGDYYEIKKPNDQKDWIEEPHKRKFRNAIMFHELIHNALYFSPFESIKSRYMDEATIEDVTKKIYGSNTPLYYETTYEIILYYMNEKKKFDFINLIYGFVYDDGSIYYYRKYNPIYNVKYSYGYNFGGGLFWKEDVRCDDCCDGYMKPYIFPNFVK